MTRTAVVTGGGNGIGAGIARRLAADGRRVAVLDVDLDGARAVAAEIDGLAVHCDVSDEDAVTAAVRQVAESLGKPTVLVNKRRVRPRPAAGRHATVRLGHCGGCRAAGRIPDHAGDHALPARFIVSDMTARTATRLGRTFAEHQRILAESLPVRRVGQPADIAHAVSYLTSDDAGYVTGQILYVAGAPLG